MAKGLVAESRFHLGEKAYYIELESVEEKRICPVCKGTEKVMVVGYDRELKCPNCWDSGTVGVYREVVREVEINEIRVSFVGERPGIIPGIYLEYFWYDSDWGRTTSRDSDQLYSTREEAQAEADRLNIERERNDPLTS